METLFAEVSGYGVIRRDLWKRCSPRPLGILLFALALLVLVSLFFGFYPLFVCLFLSSSCGKFWVGQMAVCPQGRDVPLLRHVDIA